MNEAANGIDSAGSSAAPVATGGQPQSSVEGAIPAVPENLLAGNSNTENTGSKPEGEGQTDEAAKPSEVPEKYEFKPIDGVELNTQMLEEFTPIAKELGLSNEKAQKLVDLYTKQVVSQQKAQTEAWNSLFNSWIGEVKADKEIGGAELEGSIKAALNVVDKYGTPEFRQLIDPPSPTNPKGLGLGNHPEFIRILARMGKAMGEDQKLLKNTPPKSQLELAQKMFPGMN